MQQRRLNEIKATVLFALGIIILTSLVSFTPNDLAFYTSHPNLPPHNLIRGFGAHLAGILLFFIGWSSWLLPMFVLFWSVRLFKQKALDFRFVRLFGFIILILAMSSLLATFSGKVNAGAQFSHGGLFGYIFSKLVITYFGKLGAYIIFLTLTFLSLALVFDILLSSFFVKIIQRLDSLIIQPLSKSKKIIFNFKKGPELKIKSKVTPVEPSLSQRETPALKNSQAKSRIQIQIAKPEKQPKI